MLPPQVQDGRWKAVREMTNPLADQGRRGSPRYHPACPGIAGPLGIALTGETAADYSWFTGGACPPGGTAGEFGLAAMLPEGLATALWLRLAGLTPSPARWQMS